MSFIFVFFKIKPRLHERDNERDKLRKENQHLRDLLSSMHERELKNARTKEIGIFVRLFCQCCTNTQGNAATVIAFGHYTYT